MKIRHLEQKLKKSGYRFRRFGKGNHRIFVVVVYYYFLVLNKRGAVTLNPIN